MIIRNADSNVNVSTPLVLINTWKNWYKNSTIVIAQQISSQTYWEERRRQANSATDDKFVSQQFLTAHPQHAL